MEATGGQETLTILDHTQATIVSNLHNSIQTVLLLNTPSSDTNTEHISHVTASNARKD